MFFKSRILNLFEDVYVAELGDLNQYANIESVCFCAELGLDSQVHVLEI